MLFKNKTTERIKFPLRGIIPEWVTVRPNEEIELSEEYKDRAISHGLVEVTTISTENLAEIESENSSIGETKVETKKIRKRKQE